MAAPRRVTVVTPQGQVVSGVTSQNARPGATVTVLVGTGANTHSVTGQVVQSGSESALNRKSSVVPAVHQAAGATSVLPTSPEVRFLDGLVTVAVAAVTVIWTATRQPVSALAWAVFWALLGIVMAVEGRGELRYGGFGVAAANVSYLALRIAGLIKEESVKLAAMEAARIAADGRGEAAWHSRQQQLASHQVSYWGMYQVPPVA